MPRLQRLLSTLTVAGAAAITAPSAYAQSAGGAHIEVQGGWDHLAIPDQTGASPGSVTGSDRAIYGFGAGYDIPVGGGVLAGVDGDIDFGGKASCVSSVVITTDQLCNHMLHDWDVGVRLGVKTGPALLYGWLRRISSRSSGADLSRLTRSTGASLPAPARPNRPCRNDDVGNDLELLAIIPFPVAEATELKPAADRDEIALAVLAQRLGNLSEGADAKPSRRRIIAISQVDGQ